MRPHQGIVQEETGEIGQAGRARNGGYSSRGLMSAGTSSIPFEPLGAGMKTRCSPLFIFKYSQTLFGIVI